MKPNRKLALLLLAVAAGVTVAGGQPSDKLSASFQAVAKARAERITKELAQLTAHPWAGAYYYGDGLGENVSLLMAPESGFVFTLRGCLGLYDLNYGKVEATSQRLELLFEHPNDPGHLGIDPELTPVVWGNRHYLIPSNKMLEFVNQINAGLEPHKTFYDGMFLLRRGDERKAARGYPGIPIEYRSLILATPIVAHISSVGNSRLERSSGCKSMRRVTPVTLDAGSAKGVRVGMEFYAFSPPIFESVRVSKVEDGVSEADVVRCAEDASPSTKWKLSTRLIGRR